MAERGLRHGQGDGTSAAQMLASLYRGESQLWVVHDGPDVKAGVVVSVTEHLAGRKVFVDLLAGEGMAEWVDMVERALCDYRDLVGAKCVEASCRKGLAKRLGSRGWKSKAVIMELKK